MRPARESALPRSGRASRQDTPSASSQTSVAAGRARGRACCVTGVMTSDLRDGAFPERYGIDEPPLYRYARCHSRSASSAPWRSTWTASRLRVDTRKASAIVALLAVERRPYARDELAALFWPESDDESARSALRRTLSVLRAALGDRWLRVDRATVALAPHGDGVWLDLAALDAGASGGRPVLARGGRGSCARPVPGRVLAPRQPRLRRLARNPCRHRGAAHRRGAGASRHGGGGRTATLPGDRGRDAARGAGSARRAGTPAADGGARPRR